MKPEVRGPRGAEDCDSLPPVEFHRNKVDPLLQLYMEKPNTKHQRKSRWQQFQGSKFYIHRAPEDKKKRHKTPAILLLEVLSAAL